MRKITDDEFEYLFRFVDQEIKEFFAPLIQEKCREGFESILDQRKDIYEEYLEHYDCTLQDMDTYYGFKHEVLMKYLVDLFLYKTKVSFESMPDNELLNKYEQSKRFFSSEIVSDQISFNSVFSLLDRMKCFFSLTPLEPDDTDRLVFDNPDIAMIDICVNTFKIMEFFLKMKELEDAPNTIERYQLSKGQINNVFSKLCKDEKGFYILVQKEPQLIRKKIYAYGLEDWEKG